MPITTLRMVGLSSTTRIRAILTNQPGRAPACGQGLVIRGGLDMPTLSRLPTLLRGGIVVTCDDEDTVISDGEVLIAEGRIAHIGDALTERTRRDASRGASGVTPASH